MYEHLLVVNVDEGNESSVYVIGVDDAELKAFFDFATHIYTNPETRLSKSTAP